MLNKSVKQSRIPTKSVRWQKNRTLNENTAIDNNSNVTGIFKLFLSSFTSISSAILSESLWDTSVSSVLILELSEISLITFLLLCSVFLATDGEYCS